MHLVWMTGRIFLKPVPRFLLDPRIWTERFTCLQDCECSKEASSRKSKGCKQRRLRKCALGFLFSFVALITHESDFHIAQANYLLPPEVKWLTWRTLVEQLDTEHIYPNIDPRFHYGELRLGRLDIARLLSHNWTLHGYMYRWQQYSSFFRDTFSILASATLYIAIVLIAMQVGLATKTLADDDIFQSVSYGFTIFSIVGPLAVAGVIILAFCYMFVTNWLATVKYKRRRFQHIITSSNRRSGIYQS